MERKLKLAISQDADVLIIGGGGAALRAAIAAKVGGAQVLLISRSRVGYGNNTAVAGGAFAAAGGWREPKDNPAVHAQDTLRGGRFINDQRLVETMTQGSIQQVYDMEKFGVNLVKTDGSYRVRDLPGHTYPRIVGCMERRGAGISLPMRRYAAGLGIHFLEGVIITRLLRAGGAVVGAVGVGKEGQPYFVRAKATILATGGLGQLYQRNVNAPEPTGDGYALAYEAGAPLQDMEFVQFFPTCLDRKGPTALVGYEYLVFQAGAAIRNSLGQDILDLYNLRDPQSMTRDRLTQAVMQEIMAGRSQGGFLSLDLTTIPAARRERYLPAMPQGTSYEQGSLLVSPAALYAMGGVCINKRAETHIKGLYAAGEVCGGVQGANRLAGNALAECFVFGTIAGGEAARRSQGMALPELDRVELDREMALLESWWHSAGTEKVDALLASLKKTMWEKVGVIREEAGLHEALDEIRGLRRALDRASVASPKEWLQAMRLEKMLTIAEIVAHSAQMRRESRGSHYRSDFPQENDAWRCNIIVQREKAGMELSMRPVPAPD